MNQSLLILKTGSTFPEVWGEHGDFDDWFERRLSGSGVECITVDATQPFEDVDADALLITGSLASVNDRDPWIGRLRDFVVRAARRAIPMLGVCFGHQMIATALGGKVERCRRGTELGTREIRLTPEGREDALFAAMPRRFFAQVTHSDEVTSPPEGATILAENDHSAVHAMAVGPTIRGVQFHPEMDAAIMRTVLRVMEREGAPVADSPDAHRVLDNWISCLDSGTRNPPS